MHRSGGKSTKRQKSCGALASTRTARGRDNRGYSSAVLLARRRIGDFDASENVGCHGDPSNTSTCVAATRSATPLPVVSALSVALPRTLRSGIIGRMGANECVDLGPILI
jgi:hypothetical protein